MIKKIITDISILQTKSKPMAFDLVCHIAKDLIDTALYCKNECVGLSAIQINEKATVFVFKYKASFIPIINPKVLAIFGGIDSKKEKCMSLPGVTIKKRRFKQIKLQYFNFEHVENTIIFKNWDARIIQHELDHLQGRLI